VSILSNTPELQAVKHAGLQMCQAVFYKAGQVQVTDLLKLTCQGPGIVLVKMEGENITQVSVSDPNRELGEIHLSVSSKIEKSGEHFRAAWNEQKAVTEVTITLPQGNYAGQSVTIEF
jgi:chondroitin AC lyase